MHCLVEAVILQISEGDGFVYQRLYGGGLKIVLVAG